MYQRNDIREGMTVRSVDGEKLGKVFAVNEDEFLIEKGLFFPKDYVCRYSEIRRLENGEIILTHGKEGLHRFSLDGPQDTGVLAGTGGGAGVGPGALGDVVAEEPPVPVRRERVRADRRTVGERPVVSAAFQQETGGVPLRAEPVEIRKQAVEEERDIDETVRRERVDIDGAEDSRKLDLSSEDPLLRR
jgi:hypothetical protein